MLRKAGAFSLLAFAASMLTAGSAAAELPDILAGPRNQVPECVTPGRLTAYLRLRNPQLDSRYDDIATEYMRHGEALGVRWDFAFYQMIVETGALSYWRGNRHGDVKPVAEQFCRAWSDREGRAGRELPDIGSGVRAHLEHLLLYAGRPVDNPIAQRTRNVRDWGVLTPWQQTFTRPINFADMSAKWAPGTKGYPGMLQTVADRFNAEVCNRPDPQPGLMQEARASSIKNPTPPVETKVAAAEQPRPSGADLAQRAIDQAKVEGNDRRSALGVQASVAPALPPAPFKVLNSPPPETSIQPSETPAVAPPPAAPPAKAALAPAATAKAVPPEKNTGVRTASAASAAAKAKIVTETATPPAANQRCRVWTASYGGQKAMIIRSVIDQVVNFTVLDVNDGSEVREAEAFISAYARNGKIAGEYPTQTQALDKAFELCPEG